jgi:hypothetical protein
MYVATKTNYPYSFSQKPNPTSEHMSQVMTTFLIGNYAAPCGGSGSKIAGQSRTGSEVKMECNCN